MNWKQLKEFCNSLDEKQLERKVVLWREYEAISEIEPEKLSEAHYIDPDEDGEGCFPASDVVGDLDKCKKVYEKGQPILWEKF